MLRQLLPIALVVRVVDVVVVYSFSDIQTLCCGWRDCGDGYYVYGISQSTRRLVLDLARREALVLLLFRVVIGVMTRNCVAVINANPAQNDVRFLCVNAMK